MGGMLSNRSIPSSIVIPVLAYPDISEAIRWLHDAFGFTLRLRIGDHRAQLNAGPGGAVVLRAADDEIELRSSVLVRVEAVDAHCSQARQNGARILREPADHPYGERQYTAEDFAGHVWTFSQTIADVDPATWGGTPGEF